MGEKVVCEEDVIDLFGWWMIYAVVEVHEERKRKKEKSPDLIGNANCEIVQYVGKRQETSPTKPADCNSWQG